MSDPLSIIASVVGLIATSAKISRIAKELGSEKNAPASILHIGEEMDQLCNTFGQVRMLLEGHAQLRLNRSRLTMVPLYHLMTILSGCVLAYSSLEEKLRRVASGGSSAVPGARLQWNEEEAGVILVVLEQHKSSLHMMLMILQCNSLEEAMEEATQSMEDTDQYQSPEDANQSMEEAKQQLARLHDHVEQILKKISESHSDVAEQLGELMSQHHDAYDDTGDVSVCHTAHQTSAKCPLPPSSSSTTSSTISRFNDIDGASIRSTSLSMRSVRSLIPAWGEELKSSRPYKRLWRHGVDPSSSSVFSKDSNASKGDTWSMLSDMSLGDLSISEISVLELPISLSDLYDPIPYQPIRQSPRHNKHCRRVNWSSRGTLHRAIRGGKLFAFRTLLSLGANPEETDANGPLLAHAAKEPGGIVYCRLLLDRGAQVDTRDPYGRTPLSHSVQHGHADICNLLLGRGAAVDAADSSGRTPLSYCAELGCDSVCKLLLDRGAAVNSRDSYGRTPLSHSVQHGHADICNLLLGRGAAVDAADHKGRTPLSYCAEFGCDYVCKLLLDRGAAVNSRDSYGRTPLSYCAERNGCDSLYKLLLDGGGKINLADSGGFMPLYYARQQGEKSPKAVQ